MLRTRVAVALSTLVVGGLGMFSPAEASHAWGTYHWARTSNPFTLKLGNNVSSAWTSHLTTAQVDWAKSTVLNPSLVGGTSNKRCGMVAGTVQVCNGAYGKNGWLGLASINLRGSHITQGSAKMNDTYFSTAAYNNPNEKQHVMCQEIGHTFGLDHTSTDGSSQGTCMDYSSSATSTKPNQHDLDMLGSIYGHLDSTSTVAASSAASSGQEVGEDRGSWGREVARGANGESSTFERDFGDGNKVLTYVTWAEDSLGSGRGRNGS